MDYVYVVPDQSGFIARTWIVRPALAGWPGQPESADDRHEYIAMPAVKNSVDKLLVDKARIFSTFEDAERFAAIV